MLIPNKDDAAVQFLMTSWALNHFKNSFTKVLFSKLIHYVMLSYLQVIFIPLLPINPSLSTSLGEAL